jgi:putative hemolysin
MPSSRQPNSPWSACAIPASSSSLRAGRIGARIVQRLHQRLDEVVNGVQLGITMVSLTLGWIGEPMVARLVEGMEFVHRVPHAAVYAHAIAIAIAFT